MADGSTLISSFLTVSSAITILHEHTRITERSWEEIVDAAVNNNQDYKKNKPDDKDQVFKLFTIPEESGSVGGARDEYLDSVAKLRKSATKWAIILIIAGAVLLLCSDLINVISKLFIESAVFNIFAYTYCVIILCCMVAYLSMLHWVRRKARGSINTLMLDKIKQVQENSKANKSPQYNKGKKQAAKVEAKNNKTPY